MCLSGFRAFFNTTKRHSNVTIGVPLAAWFRIMCKIFSRCLANHEYFLCFGKVFQ